MPVGDKNGVSFVPQHGDADFRDFGVTLLEMLDHFANRLARVNHVVDEQDATLELRDAGNAVGDVEVGLDRALGLAVGTRGQDGKRHVVDAAKEVARAHAAARQAKMNGCQTASRSWRPWQQAFR